MLLFSGCATPEKTKNGQNAYEHLSLGKKLLAERYFSGSVTEFQKILSQPRTYPYRDEALFYMGLIYAYNGNPEKDYEKSHSFFTKLVQEYPQSPLVVQANIWSGVLGGNVMLGEKNEALKRKNEMLAVKLNKQVTANKHLLIGKKLLREGDYKGALIEIEKVLSLPYKDPDADEALYYKALIYAHYNNPDKDYKKSRELLKNILQEHPQSPFTEQVKIWLGVLDVIEKAKQVDIEIEEKMKKLNR
jgi:tetratricopeptide (TPR) repeat protein